MYRGVGLTRITPEFACSLFANGDHKSKTFFIVIREAVVRESMMW
jgi:hypothetical protein